MRTNLEFALGRSARGAGRVVALLFVLLPTPAAFGQRVELTPFVGYRFGGEFVEHGFDELGPYRVQLDLDDSASYGLLADFGITRHLQFELGAGRQQTRLLLDDGFLSREPLVDIDVDYYHAGLLYQWAPGQVRPFVVGSIGATRLDPAQGSFRNDAYFSASAGGGVKVLFGDNLGLRLEGRFFSTAVDQRDAIYCSPFGSCSRQPVNDVLEQLEMRAGLLFAF